MRFSGPERHRRFDEPWRAGTMPMFACRPAGHDPALADRRSAGRPVDSLCRDGPRALLRTARIQGHVAPASSVGHACHDRPRTRQPPERVLPVGDEQFSSFPRRQRPVSPMAIPSASRRNHGQSWEPLVRDARYCSTTTASCHRQRRDLASPLLCTGQFSRTTSAHNMPQRHRRI